MGFVNPDDNKALGKIRLVAMDLDGTLLTRDNGVSRFNAAMVRKATRAGIKIVLATGRSSGTAERIGRRLGLPGPFICANALTSCLPSRGRTGSSFPSQRASFLDRFWRSGFPRPIALHHN